MKSTSFSSNPLKNVIYLMIISILVSISVLKISEFGSIALLSWSLILVTVGLGITTGVYNDIKKLRPDQDKNSQIGDQEKSDSSDQLREFIYLDSLSMQSLLASMEVGSPELIRELSEQSQTERREFTSSANVGTSEVGSISGGVNMSNSETGKEVLEIEKKISDQHRFKDLYSKLEDNEKITVLPQGWSNDPEEYNLDASGIDIVEFTGKVQTDPLYRMINVISLIARSISLFTPYLDVEDSEQLEKLSQENIEEVREAVYGNQVGLKIEVDDSNLNYVAALEEDKLWIDNPRREFSGSKEYTVLGRVVGVVGENNDWDYIDVFRVTGTVLGTESMSTIRELISDLIEMIDGFEKEVPVPNFSEMDLEEMSEEIPEEKAMQKVKINIEDKDMSVEGPVVIIDPIAVYW